MVSIHAPAKGATQPSLQCPPGPAVSIHAPAKGATLTSLTCGCLPAVSIHAPAKGATRGRRKQICPRKFQSTRPRRARQVGSHP